MKTIISTTAGLIIVLIVSSCGGNSKTELARLKKQQEAIGEKIRTLEKAGDPPRVEEADSAKFRLVAVSLATPGIFDHYIKVQGKLDGDQNTAVFAEVPGTVSALYADVGMNVSKGQVLAQVDDQQYRKQLESLETQYRLATDLFGKQQRLWDQKIGSEVQYLQSKTAMESLDRQIGSLRDQIEKFRIKSPVNGTIEECNIRVGSLVSPDPRSALYRVVSFRNLKVTAEVSEAYASRVKDGDMVRIFFPDLKKEINARINFVSRYIDPVNRTFTIESRIGEIFPGMKANMIAIIQINDYHSDQSISLPMNVIQTDKEGSYVYVVRGKDSYNGAFKQLVTIGNTYNGIAEILNGLKPEDKVVTTGFQELIDGEYVRYTKAAEPSRGSI